MASKGIDNWKRNWRGKGNITTFVKTPNPYFKGQKISSPRVDNLTIGEEVVYIDSLSQEMENNGSRVAFQFGNSYNPQEDVYYVQIDSLKKPISTARYAGAFKPQTFGLQGRDFSLNEYVETLKNSIISRTDIVGDLEEYLLALVDYAYSSKPVIGFDTADLPISNIRNDFGECIGPIYSIQRGLTTYGLGVNSNSTIFITSSPNEPLLDYIIKAGNPPIQRDVKVSAKSQGVSSNTLKIGDVLSLIQQNPSLLSEVGNTQEYAIMGIINDNNYIIGPIKCLEFLGFFNSNDVRSLLGLKGTSRIPNPELFLSVIQKDSRLKPRVSRVSSKIRSGDYSGVNITLNEFSYACEKLVIKYSEEHSTKYTNMIKKALANDIFFVHLNLGGGNPSFTTRRADTNRVEGQTVVNLKLRSKNGYELKKDKLGFDV